MKTVDMMKKIVTCPHCKREEYYGMLYWRNGASLCRCCIYDIWEAENKWARRATDYVFPLYEDGIDYTKSKEEQE